MSCSAWHDTAPHDGAYPTGALLLGVALATGSVLPRGNAVALGWMIYAAVLSAGCVLA